ncbi:FAD-binding protein [Anoxybacterium hadale]|uniref:FAD-binding protein n=1 Tax=Anoxybacterium hadale TaxID=3408580 RepID=A0ACD1A6J8_9FIRM|nr:FAD-binding protein [Clostridiales bacterium]
MKKPVMVVGGGIGGIQASHDLAEMGIPVFLIERSPSIGGRMAQLDKTFPTNDCSACILAPKVTATFNHPLVKTMTWSEVVEIRGSAPDFTAVIRQKARYIDTDKCTGCGDCTEQCPITLKSEFDMGVGSRKAVFKPFAQAAPNKVVIDKKGSSPCKYQCPAHIDAHGYVTLTGEGRYEEALDVVRRVTPFSGVLGRVCVHPCESNCTRRFVEQPISIAGLKRFLADTDQKNGKKKVAVTAEPKAAKIAIVGAGPAGLNCAYSLAKEGYDCTVFEKLPVAGGMLQVGIPDYRLDKKVLDYEIALVEDMGVDIKYNTEIGRDFTLEDLKTQGYQAVFLAIGAHSDAKLGIPGEENEAVISSVAFLRELNLRKYSGESAATSKRAADEFTEVAFSNDKLTPGKKIIVIGGGNVAMDSARSALRLGCDVTVVYRRCREQMPANPWEIEEAEEEGVTFLYLTSQIEVLSENGRLTGLRCCKNKLGEPDASGRRSPEAIPNSEFVVEADHIIVAIGQKVEREIESAGFRVFHSRGTILAKDAKTEMEGVFAGGDAQSGPATLIEAIAAGNRAAKAIINYVENRNDTIEPFLLPQTDLSQVDTDGFSFASRAKMPVIDMERRRNSFDEVELGYDEETARAEARRCVDCSVCCECLACEAACKAGAVSHKQEDQYLEIPVSAIVMSPGYDLADRIPPELGYEKYEDVVTSMEYERILSASGPYGGHVQRPSDGRQPKKIAFLQCVGSRDDQCEADYCSSVCCMYSVKEAQITKEHLPSVEDIHIYYMDMRAYGKDFDRYIKSGEDKYGIKFIRSRAGGIERLENGVLRLYSTRPDGLKTAEDYDLVVLATGFQSNPETEAMLGRIGVKTDRYGFVHCDEFGAPETSVEGIYACGAASGPKDIPETVAEASAAASAAAQIANQEELSEEDFIKFFDPDEEVPLRDVSNEPIRMGVFVCRCGVNIGGYVDVPDVCDYIRTLPFVVHVEDSLYTCSVDAQKNMMDLIAKHRLNRVVVASCTPRTHEPLFQSVLKKTGLNPYLFNMSNIRDQCSWVHMDDKQAATRKAKELVRMAVGKGLLAVALQRKKIPVEHSALILGGGAAGMSAALAIADMGYRAILAEKSGCLGGNALALNDTYSGRPIQRYLEKMIDRVMRNERITVHLNTTVGKLEGFVGNFKTTLVSDNVLTPVNHGVVIVATGAHEAQTAEYLHGKHPKVITQLTLDRLLQNGDASIQNLKNVVMIQCVGSREAERMYCSRVCCNQAMRNAAALRRINPEVNISVLYREMRTYGMQELNYRNERQNGVCFVNYDLEHKPTVRENPTNETKGLQVSVFSEAASSEVVFEADLVVLATAMEADREANKITAQLLKIPQTQDGFFLEAHAKLRPVDFATEGVYLCGLAHSPKNLKESMVQGKSAAGRAATVISKDFIETEGTIAKVDGNLCTACGTCETICPYGAVEVQDVPVRGGTVKRAIVNEALCKGCGTCSANCRCGAADVGGFADRQIVNEIEYLMRK